MNLPLVGEVSVVSLVVLLFCMAFAIFWAATRKASYSWFGQDVLVSLIQYLCARLFSSILFERNVLIY